MKSVLQGNYWRISMRLCNCSFQPNLQRACGWLTGCFHQGLNCIWLGFGGCIWHRPIWQLVCLAKSVSTNNIICAAMCAATCSWLWFQLSSLRSSWWYELTAFSFCSQKCILLIIRMCCLFYVTLLLILWWGGKELDICFMCKKIVNGRTEAGKWLKSDLLDHISTKPSQFWGWAHKLNFLYVYQEVPLSYCSKT